MNKDLYGKEVFFPDEMRVHLKKVMDKYGSVAKDTEGYKRNLELQNSEKISYTRLKRIKNFFDTFKGKTTDIQYILNGGKEMKWWVNMTLDNMRNNVEATKRNKMEAGFNNQFRKEHEKPGISIRPSKEHLKASQRHATSIGNLPSPVMEAIEKIKNLINYAK